MVRVRQGGEYLTATLLANDAPINVSGYPTHNHNRANIKTVVYGKACVD